MQVLHLTGHTGDFCIKELYPVRPRLSVPPLINFMWKKKKMDKLMENTLLTISPSSPGWP